MHPSDHHTQPVYYDMFSFIRGAIASDAKADFSGRTLICCYKAALLDRDDFSKGNVVIHTPSASVFFYYGSLSYQCMLTEIQDPLDFLKDNLLVNAQISMGNFVYHLASQQRHLEDGAYLIILAPTGNDEAGILNLPETLFSETRGALMATLGRNIAFRLISKMEVDISSNTITLAAPEMINPNSWPRPDVTDERIKFARKFLLNLDSLPDGLRQRSKLSLRWYERSIEESGIDALLDIWIALETIGMPNTSDIKPVNQDLSTIYGIEYHEIKNKFQVGRLQNLRSRIVHDGETPAIDSHLIDYLEAIYVDILYFKAGVVTEKRAEAKLADPEFDLGKYFLKRPA